MRNRLRQHKLILYRLKQNFGVPAIFSFPTQNDYDVTTGAITRVFTTFTVQKVIVLPAALTREFVYDLAYIAANKNFTNGGYFDAQNRNIIIQKSDLQGYVPSLEWICTFKNKQHAFVRVEETEDSEGFIVACKHLEGDTDP